MKEVWAYIAEDGSVVGLADPSYYTFKQACRLHNGEVRRMPVEEAHEKIRQYLDERRAAKAKASEPDLFTPPPSPSDAQSP